MPTNRHTVKIYLNDDELARLDELAAQLRLFRSDLLRRLMMAYRMPRPEDFTAWQGIRDLLKVNADQARLGNLLKLALDEAPPEDLMGRLNSLAEEIAQTQQELKGCARDIRTMVQPPRS